MDKIISLVSEKLKAYNMQALDELDDKTIKRLCSIEEYILDIRSELDMFCNKIKDRRPTISSITNSDKVGITRKTIYNNPILKEYIQASIDALPDYFNEKKYKKLKEDYDELEELKNKVIDSIIDKYNTEEEINEMLDTIKMLKHEIKILNEILQEKNREIEELRRSKVVQISKKMGR
ncbi:hypothetical protein [Cellulosilyticum sp. WCF-2]|uniref:hypothetical protein n=1 Tax=Cellulosilyticum sp. WCF-2 TaxID=2497860 RepID=UPI000F8D5D44|nr:hypothetical protein [Cellulosilyticum sp. WCF-2]QEH70030.1 hypothetical protein EKH84_17185 [Cellulosilyticum sp. WCF-2]